MKMTTRRLMVLLPTNDVQHYRRARGGGKHAAEHRAEQARHCQTPAAVSEEQDTFQRIRAEGGIAAEEAGGKAGGELRDIAVQGGQVARQHADGKAARE